MARVKDVTNLLISLGLAVTLTVGAEETKTADGDGPDSGATRLQTESSEALDALANYSAEQKEQASVTAKELVARLDKRIELLRNDLEANWDQMSQATREKREAAINGLAAKRDQLKKQFDALSQRSGKAWEELKGGFVRSYRTLTGDGESDASEAKENDNAD